MIKQVLLYLRAIFERECACRTIVSSVTRLYTSNQSAYYVPHEQQQQKAAKNNQHKTMPLQREREIGGGSRTKNHSFCSNIVLSSILSLRDLQLRCFLVHSVQCVCFDRARVES